ncbi:MAG: hypothetical protein KAR44_03025 [Candidatus Aegiribacteria sp.]|nr:hypothetical protein [Candidatus Aegiribacteria sp.]
MITFRIKGIVKEEETGLPLPGLFVKSYDKDLLFDDLLGSAITDTEGIFDIICESSDFRDLFEKKPDIYFKVFKCDRTTLIHDTKRAVRWNQDRISEHEILIPWIEIHAHTETEVLLTGDNGEARNEFSTGESLTIQVKGLRPGYAHDFSLSMDGKALFTSTFISNRYGDIEPTVLWPQMGLDDPNSKARFTPEEATVRWDGASYSLNISMGRETISTSTFKINDAVHTPIVIVSEKDGRLLNGFEVGTHPLMLTMRNLPFGGDIRIYMVPRQYDWQVGNPFQPVLFSNGEPAVLEVSLREGGVQQTIEFARAEMLMPGAYDFIVRPVRYGFEEDELLAVLPNDVIGSRRVTGLVIREAFWLAKPVLGGCVNRIPISGHSISGSPYFRYADTFTVGEDVWAGLDPGIVDPNNISKMCALYVIESKDAAAWSNNSLTHLPVLGGNANTIKRKLQAGCMNADKSLVWPNAMLPGEYDIVADFGNNTSDASLFVPDHAYNTPLDIIDGYFVAGFRIVKDPGTMQDFNHAGNWNYIQTDVDAMPGLSGTVTVQDEAGQYHSSTVPTIINRQLRLKANVFFPADAPGITDPASISSNQPNYPLIVIIHGNGHDYTSYDFLLEHFAKNGFIAASIDVRYFNGSFDSHGMGGQGRAEALFPHLNVINTKFGSNVQNNIGIMGHSRGGDAVVKAARINQQQALGHNINAVIALAPTDQYGTEVLGGAWSKPYFVLYGSRDGDITGGIWVSNYTVPQTGFAHYDRANGSRKSMCFVYRATHNGFITDNHDAPWDGDAIADMEPVTTQQAFTKAYMNAFYRWHLKNESQWTGMFAGEWTPGSVSSTGAIFYIQYHDTTTKIVDEFEGAVNWQASTIGGTVDHAGTLPVNPGEGKMSAAVIAGLDQKSPHDTQGMKIKWNNTGDKLVFTIPPAHKNVSAYSVLSFRVTQKTDSADNPSNQTQNFRVALKDGSNNERAVRVSPFYVIPFPDHRPNHAHSKSAMLTVRIPLKSYRIVCAGLNKVDLDDIASLTFLFSEKTTGEIEIDNIEFSN